MAESNYLRAMYDDGELTNGERANLNLEARVNKYTIKKHEGLWRFYHDKLWIPMYDTGKYKINSKNLKSGKVFIKKYSPVSGKKPEIIQKEWKRKNPYTPDIQWFEQTHWAYNDETGEVFRWVLAQRDVANVWKEKKLVGRVMPHTEPRAVLAQILDRDITVADEYSSQDIHKRPQRTPLTAPKWCVEFDGKNILALVFAKPKMTYAEIKQIIEAEGGSVDKAGIIHRPE